MLAATKSACLCNRQGKRHTWDEFPNAFHLFIHHCINFSGSPISLMPQKQQIHTAKALKYFTP